MFSRDDSDEPTNKETADDILTGEDVTLGEDSLLDATAADETTDSSTEPAAPSEPAEPPLEELSAPLAEAAPSVDEAPQPAPATPPATETKDPSSTEPPSEPAEEPLAPIVPAETTETPAPLVEPALPVIPEQPATPPTLRADFPETSRVDPASIDDLAESTSILDTDFTAPMREDIEAPAQDVLSSRETPAVIAEDGQTLKASEPSPTDKSYDTTIMRRSLVARPAAEESTPETLPDVPDKAPESPTVQFSSPSVQSALGSRSAPAQDSSPEAMLLDGASVLPTLPSRASARWISAVGTILLAPLAWYLLSDAAVRLVLADNSPWMTGQINIAALGELIGGLALLALVALVAARSSIGLFICGTIFLMVGLPFLVAPTLMSDFLATAVNPVLSGWGGFGANVSFILEFTGATGILVMTGFALEASGFVAFKIRRTGRAEESLRAEVAAVNPSGLRAHWARKAVSRKHS